MRLLIIALLLFPARAFPGPMTLEFKKNGTLVKSYAADDLRKGKLGALKAKEIDLYNAWREQRKTYVGYDLLKVLDAIYGKDWRKSKMVAFVALDGYISHSDTRPLLKAAANKVGLIAYKEKGADGFTPIKRGEKVIDPGPFYLVWSGFKEGDHAAYSDVLKWPYQLKEINVKDSAQ